MDALRLGPDELSQLDNEDRASDKEDDNDSKGEDPGLSSFEEPPNYFKNYILQGRFTSSPDAKVYLVRPKEENKKKFVMKIFDKTEKRGRNKATAEITFLNIFSPCIYFPELIETFETKSTINLVLTCASGGDFFQYFFDNKKVLTESSLKLCAAELLYALHYMHSLTILHLDIKPENILISETGHVMFIDFELSRYRNSCNKGLGLRGTPGYFPPEIMSDKYFSYSADHWSLGVVLLKIADLHCAAYDDYRTYDQIADVNYQKPDCMSPGYYKLIKALTQLDHTRRLGRDPSKFYLIQKLPYFKEIDWEAIRNGNSEPPFWPVPELEYFAL